MNGLWPIAEGEKKELRLGKKSPECAQGVNRHPLAGLALALDVSLEATVERPFQPPGALGVLFGTENIDRFAQARVPITEAGQNAEDFQDVRLPHPWECQLQPARLRDRR